MLLRALTALAVLSGGAGAATAGTLEPARITVHLESGRILEAVNADAPRWPASLAKMMTIALAFEAIEAGRLAPEHLVEISYNAAIQPRSRIGLRIASRVSVADLIAGAAVASGNDAAVALSEALGGSETLFVDQMNAAAERLGMTNTRYATASGLPQAGQRTTARDIAILSAHLLAGHPERSAVFAVQEGRIGRRAFAATNVLLRTYPGAIGLKTGFTCRGGYNLAAAARRDGQTIIAVTLGHRRSAQRRRAVTEQLDRGFARLTAVSRPETAVLADLTPGVGVARAEGAGVWPEARLASAAAGPSETPPSAQACAPSVVAGGDGLEGWGAHLGGHGTEAAARASLARATATARIRGLEHVAARRRDGRWVAVSSGHQRREAIRICAALRRAGGYCLTLPPAVLENEDARWR